MLGGLQLLPPNDATDDERARALLLDNRRRVLAVLATLALSTRPLSRDQLADFFWSDSDPTRAKHSLAEALRMLRRVFDRELFSARAADLLLDAETPLVSDVSIFKQAAAAGRDAEAIQCYEADLLDGIYVERAPRFEEFIEQERAALRRLFTECCAREAKRLSVTGQHQSAAAVARRWLIAEPLSVPAADAWLRALLVPGTAEAVRTAREQYGVYADRLATEYDATPDPRIARLLQDAIDALSAHQASVAKAGAADARPLRVSPMLGVSTVVPSVGEAPAHDRETEQVVRDRWTSTRRVAVAALAAIVVAGGAWFAATRVDPALVGSPDNRVMVVLADAESAVSDSTLAPAITLATGAALGESESLQLVSGARIRALRQLTTSAADSTARRGPFTESLARTVAQRAGAAAVIVPVLISTGSRYRVALRAVKSSDGLAALTVQSPVVEERDLLGALDEVVRKVRSKLGDSRMELRSTPPLPEYTTASLDALRAYAQGTMAFNRQQYDVASVAYRQAAQIDTSFALAWTALGRALSLYNQPQAADSAFAAALRQQRHLTPRERMLVRTAAFTARGFADSALALRAAWLQARPDDREVLRSQIFELLVVSRRADAVALAESYVKQDSLDEVVWINLSQSYQGEDRDTRRRAVAAYSRAIALDSTTWQNPMFPQLYGGLLARAQLYDSAQRFFHAFDARGPRLQGRAMRALGQMELMRGQPKDAMAPLRVAIQDAKAMADTLSWVRARLWLIAAHAYVGDSVAVRRHLDTLAGEAAFIREPQVLYWMGVQLTRAGRLRDGETVLRAIERVAVPSSKVHAANRTLLQAELAVGRGRAGAVLPGLRAAMLADSSAISLETWGWVALQAGDRETARDAQTAIFERVPGFGFEGWLARDRAQRWRPLIERSTAR